MSKTSIINWPLLAVILIVVTVGALAYFDLLPGWSNVW